MCYKPFQNKEETLPKSFYKIIGGIWQIFYTVLAAGAALPPPSQSLSIIKAILSLQARHNLGKGQICSAGHRLPPSGVKDW